MHSQYGLYGLEDFGLREFRLASQGNRCFDATVGRFGYPPGVLERFHDTGQDLGDVSVDGYIGPPVKVCGLQIDHDGLCAAVHGDIRDL